MVVEFAESIFILSIRIAGSADGKKFSWWESITQLLRVWRFEQLIGRCQDDLMMVGVGWFEPMEQLVNAISTNAAPIVFQTKCIKSPSRVPVQTFLALFQI